MEDNNYGDDNIKQDNTENAKKIGSCNCNEEASKKKSECECHEETFEEDCDCDTENNEPNHDEGCGCGTENLETSENDDCCCGSIDFPDLSRVDNPDKPKFTANEEFIKEFEDYAHSLGISNVGYSLLTPKLLIKDKFIQYPFTIVLNIEMHKDIIDTPPGIDAKDLNDTAYVKLAIITTKLSDYLRKNGFGTEIAHPYGGLVNFSALGQEAGTGYIGESGLLISPELGPRQKISAIFTSISNLPLNEENEHAWIPEYCEICGKCVKACPEKALVEVDSCCGSEVELVKKNCIGCSLGCTYCIEACPFEEKGYEHVKNKFDKINAKLKEKQAKYFDVKLWNNWVNENTELFKDLLNDFTMAIAVAENENILLINKVDNELKVGLKPFDELEKCKADLLFVMDEKTIEELLKDFTTVKLSKLLSSKEIDVYGLNDQLELKNNGYIAFLNKLGISLGDGSCCS